MQKLIAFTLAALGAWIFIDTGSYLAIIPIVIAALIYNGANHGMWISFDLGSDSGSGSCHGDSGGSGCDGGGGD